MLGAHEGAVRSLIAQAATGSITPIPAPARIDTALLQQHHLAPLAYRAGWPGMEQYFARSAIMWELRRPILEQAIGAIVGAGLRVARIKGVAYATRIYRDPAERPMGDIDLLVPASEHAEAQATLERLGYRARASRVERSRFHHATTLERDGAAIDLHRAIVQPLRSRVDSAGLWSRAQPDPAGGYRLAPVDEALIHLVHMARHELMVPLINYVDAARLLAGVTRTSVRERAREWRVSRGVSAALSATDAFRDGNDISWQYCRFYCLPDAGEIVRGTPPRRAVQLARKAALLDNPGRLAGLLAVALLERARRRTPVATVTDSRFSVNIRPGLDD